MAGRQLSQHGPGPGGLPAALCPQLSRAELVTRTGPWIVLPGKTETQSDHRKDGRRLRPQHSHTSHTRTGTSLLLLTAAASWALRVSQLWLLTFSRVHFTEEATGAQRVEMTRPRSCTSAPELDPGIPDSRGRSDPLAGQ